MNNCKFLPVCRADMEERGIEQLDFVYVIGDAYVDHPSFGHAIISRDSGSPEATRWESFPSRTGKIQKALLFLENPDWRFWSVPEIWIPW